MRDPKVLAKIAYDLGWNWRIAYDCTFDEAVENNPYKNDYSDYGSLCFKFFLEGFKACDSYLKLFEDLKKKI